MKNIFKPLFYLLLLTFSTNAFAQACALCSSLEVNVSGIKNNVGIVRILLVNDSENFMQTDPKKINASRVYFRNAKADVKGVTFTFKELPARSYAFKVFHDENTNEVLDLNLLGQPLEGIAFSELKVKSAEDLKAGTSFEKASFKLPPAKKISKSVKLRYFWSPSL